MSQGPPPAGFNPSKLSNAFWGHIQLKAISAVAELGVCDIIKKAGEPLHADDIASSVGANGDMLYRLMRYLSSEDGIPTDTPLFTEDEKARFSLTPYGEFMCDDHPSDFRALCLHMTEPGAWGAIGSYTEGLKRGESPFSISQSAHANVFEYFQSNDAAGLWFNRSMKGLSDNSLVPKSGFDFSGMRQITDIGGSHGGAMVEIMKTFPNVEEAICFDLPHVLLPENPSDKVTNVGGDFFKPEDIPVSENFFLKHIVHDWGDVESVAILKNAVAKLKDPETGRVILVDHIVPSVGVKSGGPMKRLDVWMNIICPGGKERTIEEWKAILDQSGLELVSTTRVCSEHGPSFYTFVIEAKKKSE